MTKPRGLSQERELPEVIASRSNALEADAPLISRRSVENTNMAGHNWLLKTKCMTALMIQSSSSAAKCTDMVLKHNTNSAL